MTTPSGQIGLNDVNAELGYSPTALITMNDSAVRTLAGVGGSGTVISMNDLRGKSNRVVLNLTISASTYNYDAYTAASSQPTYNPGKTDLTITVNPGVTVGSTSTGAYAFSIPSSFGAGDTVTIVNNGVIQGMGGNGGPGSPTSTGTPGSSGGSAVYVARPTTFTNNGTLAGGGGGGGGGGAIQGGSIWASGGGGGGGSGYNGGSGGGFGPNNGSSPTSAQSGGTGTSPAGGSGGSGGRVVYDFVYSGGAGGAGGGRGASGSSGGSGSSGDPGWPAAGNKAGGSGGGPGAYMVGAPLVTWPATGTRQGPVS